MSRAHAHELWRRFVSPDFVELLEAFDFGRCFNMGHNHPVLVQALQAALAALFDSQRAAGR
jgi:acetylornithine/succinyldiaminopimelate/putrescine aminotransferase